MTFAGVITERFADSFQLYDQLVSGLDRTSLAAKLPGLPSNAIGAQLWCVVGARESFARAIAAGQWSGFSCSLSAAGAGEPDAVAAAVSTSADQVLSAMDDLDPYDEARCRLALRLLEHETAHHGQLIRYLYGLRLPIPELWRERYSLD